MDLVGVSEAAALLGVSERQVRRLAAAGELPGQRIGERWLFDADEVRQVGRAERRPGRPPSALMAWAIVGAVGGPLLPAVAAAPALTVLLADRRMRHRLSKLIEDAPPVERWDGWLRHRARDQRIWIHPGLLERVDGDPRLHPSDLRVLASIGLGAAHGQQHRYYVHERHVDEVLRDYRAQPADDGQVLLRVVPAEAPEGVLGPAGEPVPPAAVLVDLLASSDARERHAAQSALAKARFDSALAPATGSSDA